VSDRKKVSLEVAAQIGISRKTLTVYLVRNPDLRPSERLPNGDLLWSEEEIEALIDRRSKGTKEVN